MIKVNSVKKIKAVRNIKVGGDTHTQNQETVKDRKCNYYSLGMINIHIVIIGWSLLMIF